ncbi:ABC transporter permease [Calderihabitans maritimus]|uniref:Transport permease protein n=1 Tax=Calderihabitans maritimus TaxID=1246530 RepID=A0A1Z5HWQ0_9FIRM|nr:ABC transporter permease [Calderihabitans maritimus]GAW93956.1 ABC-type multidrug transport system, permease component [Calderihabitans maritimus]
MTRNIFPDLTHRTWLVLRRNLLVFKKTWVTNIAFNFIEPLLYLIAMGYGLGSFVPEIQGMSYIEFIAPGLIASSAMWASAAECTYDSFSRMHYRKVYHAIIATPLTVDEVVAGEILYGTFKSVLYGTVILLVISLLGLVKSPWALLVPGVLILCGLVFAELGMLWTGLVPNIDTFSYFFTLIITPMFLFSGVFFPIDGMPAPLKILAWFTPLYHIVELIRSLVAGTVNLSLLYNTIWLIAFIILFFNLPIHFMRRRLVK